MKYVQDVILFEILSMNTLCSIISVLTWTDGPCGSSWTCSWTWTGGGGGRSWTAWTGSSWTMLTWGSSWTVGGVALWTTTAFATGSLKICSIFHVWFRIYEVGRSRRRSKSRLKEREKGQGDRGRKREIFREREKEGNKKNAYMVLWSWANFRSSHMWRRCWVVHRWSCNFLDAQCQVLWLNHVLLLCFLRVFFYLGLPYLDFNMPWVAPYLMIQEDV